MRRFILTTLILSFLIAYGPRSEAFWWERKKKVEKPPGVEEVKPEVEEIKEPTEEEKRTEEKKRLEAKRALIESKRKQLNNNEWEIELISLSGSSEGRKESDVITFSNNQIVSASLLSQGFSSTNYTLTVQDDGGVVWETMQTSGKGRIAFWRGEVDQNMEKMHGILSRLVDDKTSQDYSFRSITKKAIMPSEEE